MAGLDWLLPDKDKIRQAGGSSHVHIARVVLPVIALVLIGVTIIWMQVNPETAVKQVSLKEVQNTLDTARFTSVDEKGRPFVIEADKVLQQDPTTMTATLDGPRGQVTLGQDDEVSVIAKKGVYDHPNQMLHLNGEVKLDRNQDFTLTTDHLDINLKDRSAKGDAPVSGKGKDGSAIEAGGVRVDPGGSRLIFTGPAKLTIIPKEDQAKDSTAP